MQSITTGFQRTDRDAFSVLILKWVSPMNARLDCENMYHCQLVPFSQAVKGESIFTDGSWLEPEVKKLS
jgi:hypothetical protein